MPALALPQGTARREGTSQAGTATPTLTTPHLGSPLLDPRHALTCDDTELAAHMSSLDEQGLITFLAQLEEADQHVKRTYHLPSSAHWYAAHGWPVFPLVERGKRPLTANGFLDATTDLERVESWWARRPDANIGTPTGRREQGGCGYDVIDVDGPDGFASIAALQHAHCPPDCCATSVCRARGNLPNIVGRTVTPGDSTRERPRPPGAHYFSLAAGTSCTTRALPGIDLRGDGGYVVLPPSIGPDGGRYTWTQRPPVEAT